MDSDTDPYIYKPLPDLCSIRLFDLQPGVFDDPLECSLKDYGLDDLPDHYAAISYVWGDPLLKSQTISCDGRRLDVSDTLHDALLKLRHARRSRLLWADAICINQGDVAERSHQVTLMGGIFRGAAVVTISLGDDEEGEEWEILNFARGMVDHFDMMGNMSMWEGQTYILRESPSRNDECNPFQGLLRLFRMPWFSRTWVIQEYGLAKTAMAMFGDEIIPFRYIGVAAAILLEFFREHLVPLEVKQTVDMVNHLYLMFSPEVLIRNFTHLIDDARIFNATDPRDKIYAFLEHPHARLSTGEAIIKPDYRKSTLEVYRKAAVALIQQGQSIDILCAVQHDPDAPTVDPDFPSWVPRFDKYYGSRVLGRFTSKHFASGNRRFPLELIPEDGHSNSLTVRGIFFDTICSHSLLLHARAFDLTEHDNLIKNPVSAIFRAGKLDSTTALYPSGDTMKKAFISAFTAGTSFLGSTLEADFSAYWLRIFEAGFDPEDCSAFEAQYHRDLRILARGGSWMRFQDVVADVCNGRKFLFTTMGYFGVGPGAMQLDDRIIVLFGADVPMVVRPRADGRYTLVGECYVHGIMTGQVVRTWRGMFPPGVGQPHVLNEHLHAQFVDAEPLKLDLVDIELV